MLYDGMTSRSINVQGEDADVHHATHESSAAKILRMLCDLKKLYIQIVLMSVLYRFVAVSDRPLQCLCLCMSFLEAGL